MLESAEATSSDLQHLAHAGMASGTGTHGNVFDLDHGKVLFAPSTDMVVKTHEGEIVIAAGSYVWVVETGNDVAVCNLHDDHRDAVQSKSAIARSASLLVQKLC